MMKHRKHNQYRQKQISISGLIGLALQEWDSEESWRAIATLREYATPEMLSLIKNLSQSKNWRKRSLAINIICQLRVGLPISCQNYAPVLAHEILFRGLEDSNIHVVEAAIYGFGHCMHPDAPQKFLQFVKYSQTSIRFALAFALSRETNDTGVNILLELARDSDNDVRDWATFAMGTQNDADTPEIRECLWRNVNDVDENVRNEAIMGLARRKDLRVLPILKDALAFDGCQTILFDAAIEMQEPVLAEPLERLYTLYACDSNTSSYWLGCVKDAIVFYNPNFQFSD